VSRFINAAPCCESKSAPSRRPIDSLGESGLADAFTSVRWICLDLPDVSPPGPYEVTFPARSRRTNERARGEPRRRILRVLPPWYLRLRISPLNRPRRLCLRASPDSVVSQSSRLLPDDGGSSSLSGSPRYPMRMWVRPLCDLSVPGEHNAGGEGRGRKRRIERGGAGYRVSRIHKKSRQE